MGLLDGAQAGLDAGMQVQHGDALEASAYRTAMVLALQRAGKMSGKEIEETMRWLQMDTSQMQVL